MSAQDTPVRPAFEPQLIDLLNAHGRDIFQKIHVSALGKIVSVDRTKKTAEVQLLLKRILPDGTTASFPPLLDVPLLTVQGGGVYLQMPVGPGDQVLVIFLDSNRDVWFKTGAEGVPYDARSHVLSDAVAIAGLDAMTSAQPAIPSDRAQLVAGGAAVRVMKDGSSASVVQGTGEVTAVGGKIRIKNTATDLLTALNALINAIEGLTVTDPQGGTGTVSPASTAVLEGLKTTLAGLLVSS